MLIGERGCITGDCLKWYNGLARTFPPSRVRTPGSTIIPPYLDLGHFSGTHFDNLAKLLGVLTIERIQIGTIMASF